jgi:hypothetical protein
MNTAGRLLDWVRWQWQKQTLRATELHHYSAALPADLQQHATPLQLRAALEQFDVVGVTERIPELVT